MMVLISQNFTSSIRFHDANGKVIVEIKSDGKVFWNDKEIIGDDTFKEAMMEVHNILSSTPGR